MDRASSGIVILGEKPAFTGVCTDASRKEIVSFHLETALLGGYKPQLAQHLGGAAGMSHEVLIRSDLNSGNLESVKQKGRAR